MDIYGNEKLFDMKDITVAFSILQIVWEEMSIPLRTKCAGDRSERTNSAPTFKPQDFL